MSESDDLRRIKEILGNPSEDGIEELVSMTRTKAASVVIAAADAILHLGFGPPSRKANEELAVWLESAGVDLDEIVREAAKTIAKLHSKN
jgi:hypothetical protein